MKKNRINRMMNKWYGRLVCRVLGEEKGAVAMEYIVIALLVAAAVVALVMVFGGNLRNMLSHTNDTLSATKPSEVDAAGADFRSQQSTLKTENKTAVDAGNKLGGDFGDGGTGSGGSGNGGGNGGSN